MPAPCSSSLPLFSPTHSYKSEEEEEKGDEVVMEEPPECTSFEDILVLFFVFVEALKEERSPQLAFSHGAAENTRFSQ